MQKILQIDFPFNGPFGEELANELNTLAISITEEPGFVWKIWTENESLQEAGGIYLFSNEGTASAYLEKHSARLEELGVTGVRGRIFSINSALSAVTRAPVPSLS